MGDARALRVMGIVATVLTLAAAAASFAWFARHGIAPIRLIAASAPLWAAVSAGVAIVAGAGWMLDRLSRRGGP